MTKDITIQNQNAIQLSKVQLVVPTIIIEAGERAGRRFVEFFTANIRNKNTREAYGRAVRDFFNWCDQYEIGPLIDIEPVHIAAYIEQLTERKAAQTVKQQLAAIRALFDFLVTGGVLPSNPASSVRGPKHSQKKGKTPILSADDARELIRSIDVSTIVGLRDRAIIGVMTYAFARVSATLAMKVKEVYPANHRLWLRFHEKGGKYHEMPCHHSLEVFLREYIEAANLEDGPLFPSLGRGRGGQLTDRALHRMECLAMIKRRCKKAGIENAAMIGNHSFRGTGLTAYLSHPDARLELAQQMAAHSDPKTTRMYDRRSDEISLDEVEKIGI